MSSSRLFEMRRSGDHECPCDPNVDSMKLRYRNPRISAPSKYKGGEYIHTVMSKGRKTCGMFTFRLLDTIALVALIAIQSTALNFYIIHHFPEQSLWYLLFLGDGIILVAFIIASVISYRHILEKFHERISKVDIPHIEIPMYGVLPFGYITWLLYASLLTAKVVIIFKEDIARALSETELLNESVLKISLASAAAVFVLLVNTHHDADLNSDRATYIADLCKGTTFDILDSVAFLSILFRESHDNNFSSDSILQSGESVLSPELYDSPLSDVIIAFACFNFFLPSLALMKLSLSDFCECRQPIKLDLLYKTLRFFLVDLPYMVIRLYLWKNDRGISLFLLKNILYVLISLRYLVPEVIDAAKRARRIHDSNSSSRVSMKPSAPDADETPAVEEEAAADDAADAGEEDGDKKEKNGDANV